MNLNTQEYKLIPVSVSKNEVWFRLDPLNNTYVVIQPTKTGKHVFVVQNGELKGNIPINPPLSCTNTIIQVEINGVKTDICQSIEEAVNKFEDFVNQWLIVERAKAGDLLGVIPKLPSDWEATIEALSKLVLSGKIVKTFFIEGAKEAVLGIYCYQNGYYSNCEESLKIEINNIVSTNPIIKMKATPQLFGQVLKKIELMTLTPYIPLKKCLLFKDKVFCWDKFIETKNIEDALIDPSPDLIITHRIPWQLNINLYKQAREGILKYIPPSNINELIEVFKALAPKSFKAFMDWVKEPNESETDALPKIALLLEIIGYTFYVHDYPFNKAVLLVGTGSNGKSKYLQLITTILGKENVSSINMSYLDPRINRFAAAGLFNKMANVSSEPIKSRSFDPTYFKMLTGEDMIYVENKFKDGFTMYNYAKLIFSANELPEITEDTYAFWRRWIVIEFPNVFPPDNTFFQRTFTPEEIEAIIICALHAFRLVLERKSFSDSGINVKEEWISRSNPVYNVMKKMFEDGVIELDPVGAVVKKDLYELYKRYVEIMREEEEDLTTVSQKDFTIHITRFFPIRSGKPRMAGKSVNAYIGVKIKDYDKALELVGHLETPRPMEEWFK